MVVFRELLKKGLSEILNSLFTMVDRGECDNVPVEKISQIQQLIITQKGVSSDGAIKHLGISRTMFYQLKKTKEFPKPKKQQGFKELVYDVSELNKYIEKNNPKF